LVSAGTSLAVETGGLLLGYRAEGELVVVDATGPGPNACHRRFSFNPDGCWQREQLAKIYRETDGVLTYLGDWHTHPGGLPLPSAQDKATAAAVAAAPRARTANPLTLIAGISASDVLFCAYLFDGIDLAAVPVSSFTSTLDYEPRLPDLAADADEESGLERALLARAALSEPRMRTSSERTCGRPSVGKFVSTRTGSTCLDGLEASLRDRSAHVESK
jgi:integrative and conjugative element protein (TIGR02256 family)